MSVLDKWNTNSMNDSISIYNMFCWSFKPTVETYCLEKKKGSFQNTTANQQWAWSLKSLIEMYNEINVICMPANIYSVDHRSRLILTFKSYH